MSRIQHMNKIETDVNCQPAGPVKGERLPVQFAADFPVEFVIRRLEDVPLRVKAGDSGSFRAERRQP